MADSKPRRRIRFSLSTLMLFAVWMMALTAVIVLGEPWRLEFSGHGKYRKQIIQIPSKNFGESYFQVVECKINDAFSIKYMTYVYRSLNGEFWIPKFNSMDNTPVTLSPNGTKFLRDTIDNGIQLWDLKKQTLIETIPISDSIKSIEFSKDASKILFLNYFGDVKVWDNKTKKIISTINSPVERIQFVCFSPNTKNIAAASNNSVWLINLSTRKKIKMRQIHSYPIKDVEYSPDSKVIVSISDDAIAGWEGPFFYSVFPKLIESRRV